MWGALATVYEGLGRIQDAIAAHTRALLGADRTQTPEHLGKLAALHTTLDAQRGLPPGSDAVGYHRKILALGQQQGLDAAELAPNFIAVAEYEMRQGANGGERGDWALAAQYLERVMLSNAPQRDKAEELRRELRIREARMN
jgi:anaphase-promoting complex subunit 8